MKKPKQKTFSEFLLNERKKRCLTQLEMAEKLGVSRSYYVILENGYVRKGETSKAAPGREFIKKLSELTGFSTEAIYEIAQK